MRFLSVGWVLSNALCLVRVPRKKTAVVLCKDQYSQIVLTFIKWVQFKTLLPCRWTTYTSQTNFFYFFWRVFTFFPGLKNLCIRYWRFDWRQMRHYFQEFQIFQKRLSKISRNVVFLLKKCIIIIQRTMEFHCIHKLVTYIFCVTIKCFQFLGMIKENFLGMIKYWNFVF